MINSICSLSTTAFAHQFKLNIIFLLQQTKQSNNKIIDKQSLKDKTPITINNNLKTTITTTTKQCNHNNNNNITLYNNYFITSPDQHYRKQFRSLQIVGC